MVVRSVSSRTRRISSSYALSPRMISRGRGSGSNIHLHAPTEPDTRPERTMLTVAEELGLSGLALSSRVQRALYGVPEPELLELIERLRQGAMERHVIYLH